MPHTGGEITFQKSCFGPMYTSEEHQILHIDSECENQVLAYLLILPLTPIHHVGFIWHDHPWRVLGSLYRCTKFRWNWCSIFDNM